MSDMREDSFYEISLTHRQILSIFVVLLGCVVAAFLSGVWLGQRGGRGPGPDVVMVEGDAEGDGGSPTSDLERLNFFREGEERPQPAVRPRRGTTLADDLGGEEGAPAETPPPASSPAPPAASVEAVGESPAGPAVAEAAPAAPSDVDGIVIQVFSSEDREQAERIVADLKSGGHPAFLSPVDVHGKTMFRVRIGPFDQRSRAERVAENVRRTFRLDTWITQSS